jgi:hypothetical protein
MSRLKHVTWPAVSSGPTPALLLTGMVLGIACGAFGAYRQVRKYLKD